MQQQKLDYLPSRVGLRPFSCRTGAFFCARCLCRQVTALVRCGRTRCVVSLVTEDELGQWRYRSCCTSTVQRRPRAWSLSATLCGSDGQHESCGPHRLPEADRCCTFAGGESGRRCCLSAGTPAGFWGSMPNEKPLISSLHLVVK